jgi:hypothetical protein
MRSLTHVTHGFPPQWCVIFFHQSPNQHVQPWQQQQALEATAAMPTFEMRKFLRSNTLSETAMNNNMERCNVMLACSLLYLHQGAARRGAAGPTVAETLHPEINQPPLLQSTIDCNCIAGDAVNIHSQPSFAIDICNRCHRGGSKLTTVASYLRAKSCV